MNYKTNQKRKPNRIYLHEKLVLTVIKDCKTISACKFKIKIGFNPNDVFNTKEKTVSGAITDVFEG